MLQIYENAHSCPNVKSDVKPSFKAWFLLLNVFMYERQFLEIIPVNIS